MGKVDVMNSGGIVPTNPEHAAVAQKCMSPNEDSPSAEETVRGQAFNDAEMLPQHRCAAKTDRPFGKIGDRSTRRARALALDSPS